MDTEKNYSVWVGGTEVNDYLLTLMMLLSLHMNLVCVDTAMLNLTNTNKHGITRKSRR